MRIIRSGIGAIIRPRTFIQRSIASNPLQRCISSRATVTAHTLAGFHTCTAHRYQIPSFSKADRLFNRQMMQLEYSSLKQAEELFKEGKADEARETLLSILDWHNTNSFDAATCLFENEPTAEHLRRLEKTSQRYQMREFVFQILETLYAESLSGHSLYHMTSEEVKSRIEYARKWTPGEWQIEFNSTRSTEEVLAQLERYAQLLHNNERSKQQS